MPYYSYTNTEKALGCSRLHNKTSGEVFVIMGFQRSGTSLLANIVHSCGVNFGKKNQLKEAQITNPDGFYEHKDISALSWKYLRETGSGEHLDFRTSFHTNTWWRRVQRLLTLRKMHRTLYDLSKQDTKWAIKNFPTFYYIWRDYLPKHKIIGIYRDPHAATHSFLNVFWPSKFTFEHGLQLWEQAQRDMIYHTSQTESILIRYEDLIDESKNEVVIQKIINFIGGGSVSDIKKLIKPNLNRMSHEVQKLKDNYPTNSSVENVLRKLESLKNDNE